MKAQFLSKTRIQNGRQCHKRLWLEVHQRHVANWGAASQLRLDQGTAFGELARELLGAGALVAADHTQSELALAETERLLALPREQASMIFEAAFEHARVRVRVDALRRDADKDVLIEVKSTASAKPEHIWDCAIQTWVARGTGRPVNRIYVAHLNRDFVYARPGDYSGLIALTDITAEVDQLQSAIPELVDQLKRVASGPMAQTGMGRQCSSPYACPFVEHCQQGAPALPRYPVSILPHASAMVDALAQEGHVDLLTVPMERLQNPQHRRIAEASRTGRTHVELDLIRELSDLSFPRYFLDFETISFPVPRWLGTRPFQQVAFQFSCHQQSTPLGPLRHHEFLDTEDSHPEARLAARLVEALGDDGPILVWNRGFEAMILRQMAESQPTLRWQLLALVDRLVDLLPLFRRHYYHPAQMGSWSLKAVLPTVDAGLSYEGLEVASGMDAQTVYVQLLEAGATGATAEQLRQALKRYCAMDTIGLVALAGIVAPATAETTDATVIAPAPPSAEVPTLALNTARSSAVAVTTGAAD